MKKQALALFFLSDNLKFYHDKERSRIKPSLFSISKEESATARTAVR